MTDDTLTRVRATLARLAEAERAATPGPWECSHGGYIGTAGTASGPHVLTGYEFDIDDTDAAAIVALRNAAPALLALADLAAWRRGVELARAAMAAEPLDYEGEEYADQVARCHALALEEADLDARWGPCVDAALAALADAPGEVQP